MSLLERINEDFKEAYKAKEEARVSTLRLLKSALKNKQIELQKELADADAEAVVRSQIKQLKEALETSLEAGRDEAAQAAKKEIALLEEYLPAQLEDAELDALVKDALSQNGASSKADFGRAMGAAMKAVAGRAESARVKAAVEKLLGAFVLGALLLPETTHAASLFALDVSSGAYFETVLRIVRVTLMLFGLIFVNMILVGGFTYMLASGNNDAYADGMKKFVSGLLGSVFIAGLFSVATVALGKM